MIRISIDFKDGKKFENLIKYIENNLAYGAAQEAVYNVAHTVEADMKEVINTSRKNPTRPEDKLINAITTEDLTTTGGIDVGIGRIAKLVAEAPYWELINDGGTYVTRATHKVPTEYFADAGTGFVTFVAGSSHTIQPVDFVGKSIRGLDRKLTEVCKKITAEFIQGMEKASSGMSSGTSVHVAAWGKNVRFGGKGTGGGMGQAR